MSEPSSEEVAAAFGIHEQAAAPVAWTRKTRQPVHREYPNSPDSERGVLASILMAPDDALDICAEKGASADSFYIPAHAELFRAFYEIRESKRPVEFLTIAQHLRDNNKLEAVGGAAYLNELFILLPSAANIGHYLDDLIAKAVLRKVISVTTRAASAAYEHRDAPSVQALLNDVERDVLAIRNNGDSNDDDRPIVTALQKAVANIQGRFQRGAGISGMSWGLKSVDLATDGLVRGEFIILAGLPACGKTSFLRQTVRHVAANYGPVGVWNLEMSDDQLAEAWIYTLAEVNPVELRYREPTDSEFARIHSAAVELSKLPIILKGRPGMSVQAFQASVRRLVRRRGIVLAVVDSATQVTSDNPFAQKRFEDVVDLSPGFKAAAKENDIPVAVLWHLNSNFELRLQQDPETLPIYRDLEGGAAGSRNCDKFCAIIRCNGFHKFATMKQRMGEPTTEVPLIFEGRYTRFTEPEPTADQSEMQL